MQSENLDDYIDDVKAFEAGTKPDERKLLGLRMVRRLDRFLEAFAAKSSRWSTWRQMMDTSSSFDFFGDRGYKTGAFGQEVACKSSV